MARITNNDTLGPIIDAAQKWIRQCLIEDGSCLSAGSLWTLGNVEEVKRAFVDNPDLGKDDFLTKLKGQMQSASPAAKKVMAEMLWALLLFPARLVKAAKKREQVRELWALSGESLSEAIPSLSNEILSGVGSGGTAFNTLRWREMVFLLTLVTDLKHRAQSEREKILVDYDSFVDWIEKVPRDGDRQFRHMLRYFAFPDRVERMSSNGERQAVLEGFGVASQKESSKWTDRQFDDALLKLRSELESKHPGVILDFYETPLRNKWRQQEKPPDDSLGAPFSDVFTTTDEAQWGFDLIQSTLLKLGVTAADAVRDRRICLSLSKRSDGVRLRLNFGNWPILTFLKKSLTENRIEYICQATRTPASSPADNDGYKMANKIDGQDYLIARGPIGSMREPASVERKAFEESLIPVAGRFKDWKAGPYQGAHQPKVLEMAFDRQLRDKLLSEGLKIAPQNPNHWIFQGNPDLFNIDEYLKTRAQIRWQVRQHADRVTEGDNVLLWRSGENGGVVAECIVESAPDATIAEDAPELNLVMPKEGNSAPRCQLKVVRKFTEAPIFRDIIKNTLPDLRIIKAAQSTIFPVSEDEYATILALKEGQQPMSAKALPEAHNIILYGPPGTGKTYRLRNEYMELFTDHQVVLTAEERAAALVKDLDWWEVIALALLDMVDNRGSVAQILSHQFVDARRQQSANKNPRAMLWASLQSHTVSDCPNVNYSTRIAPLVFSKNDNAVWSLDVKRVDSEAPELRNMLDDFRSPEKKTAPLARRYKFTTFHQSFSYEDFIEGIKPQMEGRDDGQIAYEIRDGVFKEICKEAAANRGEPYALFVDEINRGNVASIFGELITLIEEDKRLGAKNELKATLPYSRDDFGVPDNLYIIGTMNTADRSVEALDTALRRRFTFEEMRPNPDLIKTPDALKEEVDLRRLFDVINDRIERLLDHDHCIGHAYFMDVQDLNGLRRAFSNKIIPLLREYFYGTPGKVGMVLGSRFVSMKGSSTAFASGNWGMDDLDDKAVYQFANVSNLSAEDFASIYA
jgi:hypothetical protein